ncbi:hypothetical protein BJ508DRAFT_374762 [Ascobolus immersus RN42]|uniref:DUF7580 domain-containing protein n=1 Tax=Ascobolus immersus RN42 TaxID=1160509 RepID=A0A3N4IGN9_ASCIM|nr:hypothetical protein BJ508DRAFT_374762 [Ascobolus immersus RN42]
MEVAGLVMGAFPLVMKGFQAYCEQFDNLEDYWRFRTSFLAFTDKIRHQMMLYNKNMQELLDPIIPDRNELERLMANPKDPGWSDAGMEVLLKQRLAGEHDRFLRTVDRMEEEMVQLRNLLKIENDEIPPWLIAGDNPSKPWEWHLQRFRISFSHKKGVKIEKLTECNQVLKEILGCNNLRIAPSSDSKRTFRAEDDLLSVFEKMRQHGMQIYAALKRHIRCSHGACKAHMVCLCVRVDPKPKPPFLDLLFNFKPAMDPQLTLPRRHIRIEPTSPPPESLVQKQQLPSQNLIIVPGSPAGKAVTFGFGGSASSLSIAESGTSVPIHEKRQRGDAFKAVQTPILASSEANASSGPKRKRDILKNAKRRFTTAFLSPSSASIGFPTSPTSSSTSLRSRSSSNASTAATLTVTPRPSRDLSRRPSPASSHAPSVLIEDICSLVQNWPAEEELGIIADEHDRFFKVINSSRQQPAEIPELVPFPDIVSDHERSAGFRIDREHRLRMAAHVSALLLQAHTSPWLPAQWSRQDIHFLITPFNIQTDTPYLSGLFSPLPATAPTTQEPLQDYVSDQQAEEFTRASLRTLGIIITELIIGRNVCKSTSGSNAATQYYAKMHPDIQVVMPISRELEDEVLAYAGPELSDVVRKCFQCAIGANPNLRDSRSRQALYDNVVKPLVDASSGAKAWPTTFK